MISLQRIHRAVFVGLAASLLTWFVLGSLQVGAGVAAAQDDPTPTSIGNLQEPTQTAQPSATATALPTVQLRATSELQADGDVDGDGVADPGDTVVYSIRVSNSGQEVIGPLEISLLYDPNFVSTTTSVTEGGLFDAGTVEWTVPRLEPGAEAIFQVGATLNRRFPPGRTLVQATAVARIDGTEIARIGAAPVEVAGPNVGFTEVRAELVTDTAENGQIDPGDTVRITLGFANTGGGVSQDVTVAADYPEELTDLITSNPQNGEDIDGRLVWQIGSIPAGEQRSVQFTVRLAGQFPAGVTTYNLALSLRGATTILEERTESIDVAGPNLLVTPRVELVTDADADGAIDPGDTVRTTLQVVNVGTEPATNIVVTALYNTQQFETISVGEGGADEPATGTLTWTLPSLNPGANQLLTYVTRVRVLPTSLDNLLVTVTVASEQTQTSRSEVAFPVDVPLPTPTSGPVPTPSISEVRPAQGQGILGAYSIAFLIGAFLILSLLSIVYVASRVLPGTSEERAEIDTLEERTDHRRMVRELLEGIVLTAILFSVMVLGLQNALDQDSVNSIIAGIVGYVAGRVASSR